MSTFSTYDSTVNSFYLAFYGRPADPAGLKFWSQQLAANNGELGAITQAFATSEEAQVRFGTDSVNDRIAEIYQQLFNHTPDAEGLAYWTSVLEQGHASMADVAVAILGGAKDSDATLSQLRQQAADAFTAQVEAGSTQYDGYASIEAARILVRAVTADVTAADLDVLVKAAVSFADTATKTPQVVEAIAVNTTLLALFDTARGVKEPVALAKALADTAKAAAGDPATLESLLRGGGMDKVLKVMPAKATLEDVVDALGTGGLPAAVEVVYPTEPAAPTPTPVPVPQKTFNVSGLEHDVVISGTATDDVTVDLTTNTILRAGHTPMHSMNDLTTVFAKDYAGKVTVTGTAAEIDVALHDAKVSGVHGYGVIDVKSAIFVGEPGERTFAPEIARVIDRAASVKVIDVLSMEEQKLFEDIIGFDIAKLDAKVDETIPSIPTVVLDVDSGHAASSDNDKVTNDGAYSVKDQEAGTTLQFSLNGETGWSREKPAAKEGDNTIYVRQVDQAGNVGQGAKLAFTLDTIKPEYVDFSVDETGVVEILGVEEGDVYVEYRTGSDSEWHHADVRNDKGNPVVTLKGEGDMYIEVRQTDQAGNESDIASFSFSLDPTAPSDPVPPPTLPPVTPPAPQMDIYQRALYQFAGSQDQMTLLSYTGSVTGVNDTKSLIMSNYSGNNWLSVESQYLANGFSMTGNTMKFGAELNAGLYLLRWTVDTFTSTNGYLSNGTQVFAGGTAGAFTHDGTSIARTEYATGDTIRDASYGTTDAIIATSKGLSHIVPGKAANVVVDSGTLTIGYQDFSLAGGSLILGFDTGSDKIAIEGIAANALDRSNKGKIDWNIAGEDPVTVTEMDEGVAITLNLGDIIGVGSNAALAKSAAVLNNYIDVGLADQDLLIYVTEPNNSNSSVLFHYSDLDGNSKIDGAELTYLAMFNGGIAELNDIIVVGTQPVI